MLLAHLKDAGQVIHSTAIGLGHAGNLRTASLMMKLH